MTITELMKMIAASLWIKPATPEELKQRDFLKNTSLFGIEVMLQRMENKDWIYFKDSNDKYYCYKKFALSDEMSQYGLCKKLKPFKRPTIEEAVKEWNKKN